MAIIITSMPNWPSVKYQGYIYPDMETCEKSNTEIVEHLRAMTYANGQYDVIFESFCLPIESYPIQGFNKTSA